MLIRLDGVGFSGLTKKFYSKPYSTVFQADMQRVLCKLMKNQYFKPDFAYTGSDEISLYFAKPETVFGGREAKYLSLLASMASVEFSSLLHNEQTVAYFDARIVETGNLEDYFVERMWSVSNNFINDLYHFHIGKPQPPIQEKIDKLVAANVEIPLSRRFGHMAYWVEVPQERLNPMTNEMIYYTRPQIFIEPVLTLMNLKVKLGEIIGENYE